jgi:hypothetical protein
VYPTTRAELANLNLPDRTYTNISDLWHDLPVGQYAAGRDA